MNDPRICTLRPPHATFGSASNTGFSLNFGLEYIATSHFSWKGFSASTNFLGAFAGDLNLYQFSVNGKPPDQWQNQYA
jgi:hypothetical protein